MDEAGLLKIVKGTCGKSFQGLVRNSGESTKVSFITGNEDQQVTLVRGKQLNLTADHYWEGAALWCE